MDIPFDAMQADWQDPVTRHAIVVHLPVALATLGVGFVIASAVAARSTMLRVIAIVLYALAAGMAWFAAWTGEGAEAAISGVLPAAASEALDSHEDMADWVWIIAASVTGLLLISAFRSKAVRTIASVAAVVGSLFLAGWVGVTAHYGGTLVYQHGVNVPVQAPSHDSDDDDDNHIDPAENGDATIDQQQSPEVAFFLTQVHPILERNCQSCHNPQRQRRSGGLDLTTGESLRAGSANGPIVVPGKPEESLLITAISYTDAFLQMPPPQKGKLSDEEIAILTKWVRDGAVWADMQ
ncbi:MAG: c-type cytochrome domain-containing protein [Phycisphaerales bacterium]